MTAATLSENEIEHYRAIFDSVDIDGSGDLDRDEVESLLLNLGVHVTPPQLQVELERSDIDGAGVLDFDSFLALMARMPRVNGELTASPDNNPRPLPLRQSRSAPASRTSTSSDSRGSGIATGVSEPPASIWDVDHDDHDQMSNGDGEESDESDTPLSARPAALKRRAVGANSTPEAAKATVDEARSATSGRDVASGSRATSVMEKKPSRQTRKLISGTHSFGGIMRSTNQAGEANRPFDHQRHAVARIVQPDTTFRVLAHDMGLGKTATALQAYCAEAVRLGRVPKLVVTVPSAVLGQWADTIADWVRIDSKRVLVTSNLSKVTPTALRVTDILVVSRDLLARAYATCHQRFERHHQERTDKGKMRWVAQWDRQPDRPMHPIFLPPESGANGWHGAWDLMFVDEAHYMRNPASRWCESHAALSALATKRLLLSGTFVVNNPLDLCGLCKAGGAPRHPLDFQSADVWQSGGAYGTVAKDTVRHLPRCTSEGPHSDFTRRASRSTERAHIPIRGPLHSSSIGRSHTLSSDQADAARVITWSSPSTTFDRLPPPSITFACDHRSSPSTARTSTVRPTRS